MAEFDTIRSAAGARAAQIDEGLRAHMNKVYGTMSVGMLITFLAAWALAGLAVTTDPSAAVAQLSADKYLTQLGYSLYASPLKWVVMFAPLAFVFGFSAGINRMSAATAQTVVYIFAAVMGVSISSIFLVFTGQSIIQVFLVTAIAFAGLSIWGYTTKK
ncbi:MAG: Bax inhibitor-1 family protein, partial [Pseudomonadota bacterium]|nr:Bax inhibitor-1 family protein [Pseudomonadota bacterium]